MALAITVVSLTVAIFIRYAALGFSNGQGLISTGLGLSQVYGFARPYTLEQLADAIAEAAQEPPASKAPAA